MCGCFVFFVVVWIMLVRCGWYFARVLGCFVVMIVRCGVVPTLYEAAGLFEEGLALGVLFRSSGAWEGRGRGGGKCGE